MSKEAQTATQASLVGPYLTEVTSHDHRVGFLFSAYDERRTLSHTFSIPLQKNPRRGKTTVAICCNLVQFQTEMHKSNRQSYSAIA